MEELQSIQFENKMGKEDYREQLHFSVFDRKRWVYWSAMVLAALCTYAVLQTLFGGAEMGLLFFVSLIYLLLVVLLIVQINVMSKRLAGQDSAEASRAYTVDDVGIKSPRADGTQGTIAWENIVEAFETPGHFLFYVTSSQAFVFTKNSIGTTEGIMCIRRLAAEKLGRRFTIRMKKKRGA